MNLCTSLGIVPGKNDIAHDAYESALRFIQTKFADDKNARDILSATTEIEDVRDVVTHIQEHYESRPRKRSVKEWLQKLSHRIVYYGGVLDALSQHHPEYVALAWGTMKFIFMGIIHHAELVEQFAMALARIGYILSEARLNAELYQTGQMKEFVSALYTHIMIFLLEAAAWYKQSRGRRAFSVIIEPFQLKYSGTLEKVKEFLEIINALANGEARTEVRDIHVVIHQIQKDTQFMRLQLAELRDTVAANSTMMKRIDVRVEDFQSRIYDLQCYDVTTALKPSINPEELLRKSGSLIHRRQSKFGLSYILSNISTSLNQWAASPGSSFLVLQPGPRADSAAKEMTVDVINHIRSTNGLVFWNISTAEQSEPLSMFSDILKSLAFQVIKARPEILTNMPSELNVGKFNSRHSETEWINFLIKMFSNIEYFFLIVECEILYRHSSGSPNWAQKCLSSLHYLVDCVQQCGSTIKVVMVNHDRDRMLLQNATGISPRFVATVRRQPPQLKRRGVNPARGNSFPPRRHYQLD